ncbi:MAG: hypothetical protein R6U26_01585 [Candidatus Undinarchaeales archaeon]
MKKTEKPKNSGQTTIFCDGPFSLKVVCDDLKESKETFKEIYDKMYEDFEKMQKDKKRKSKEAQKHIG